MSDANDDKTGVTQEVAHEAPARKTRGKAKETQTNEEDRGVLTEVIPGVAFYIRS